jgi:DNA-binding transcriptional regulator YiaG
MSTDNQKKTLSPKEFANEYQVSVKTFMKWVYKIPNLIVSKPTRLFTPLQVKVIREHLG